MIWKFLPPSLAHELAPYGIDLFSRLAAARFPGSSSTEYRPLSWRGLHFRNPIGVAGGVDKDGQQLGSWEALGFGFMELGTVTPTPQQPNGGKILDRSWRDKVLWNRMGFPSRGAKEMRLVLEQWQSKAQARFVVGSAKNSPSLPLFINIGKNRSTSLDEAHLDYCECAKLLKTWAQVFVINISSPNTQGLRRLQESYFLQKILYSCQEVAGGLPLLVKLSPDLELESLRKTLTLALDAGASGFVLTNTTLSRPANMLSKEFPKEGGLSGSVLKVKSREILAEASRFLGSQVLGEQPQVLLVSAGGVDGPDEIKTRLDLGAHLLEIYSSLVFQGPWCVRRWLSQINGAQSRE